MRGAVLEVCIATKAVEAQDGPRILLRDVHFHAASGEFLALFGPSGVGKTTTLRIALGLDTAFHGFVSRGTDRVAAVFQEPRLLPWLTIEENLRLVDHGETADPTALLARVELEGVEYRRPGELSLGMARRVAIARAMVVQPDLLMLDEPFGSLDPALAGRMAGMVSGWARQRGSAVLMATHDLDQALGIADRILILTGDPATIGADVAVPEPGDLRSELRASLTSRFPFLASAEHGMVAV